MFLEVQSLVSCQHHKKRLSKIDVTDFFSLLIVKGFQFLYNLDSVFYRHLKIE